MTRLTKDSHEQLVKGITAYFLERPFRDAILLSRQLGIRYLWIDAFCVMQGCEEINAGKDPHFNAERPESIYQWLHRMRNFTARPESVLDRRAWTFQERLLSRRVFSITRKGIVFIIALAITDLWGLWTISLQSFATRMSAKFELACKAIVSEVPTYYRQANIGYGGAWSRTILSGSLRTVATV
jgi:hypothetical protein